MRSTSSQQNPPQWRLVTAIIISLLLVLFVILFLQYSAIFAAPAAFETNMIEEVSSSEANAVGSTILVGFSETTENVVNGAFLYEDAFIALDSQIASAESLISFEETAVSSTSTHQSSQVDQIYKVQLEPGADMAATIRQLEANPNVLFAEPDYLAHLITTPNDPLYGGQWGLSKINAPDAWDITTGSNGVVIAVIDSGLDTTHPDLAGQLWTNPGEIAGNGVDDDNNGHVDDIHGWNMVDNNADLSDNTGHGTEVAGVLGAVSNNGQGIAGLCWNCELMVLKVTQSGGVANYSDIIDAIDYAAEKGAEVINLSLGGASDSVSLRLAVEEAAKTAVVVGGAGNDNQDAPFYPAAYESVLAVAGTDANDAKVSSSNYGSWVDVTAPGEAITTTFDGGSYGMTSGTSMAAPYVSGLAGLLRSANTNWSANTTHAQIMQTTMAVDSVNPGFEDFLGNGRIDAAQALTTAAEPTLYYMGHEVDGVENGSPEPDSTIDLNITLANEWADATNVQARLRSADGYVTIVNDTANYSDIYTFKSAVNQTPFRVTISDAAPYAHDLVFNLNVTADGGYTMEIPLVITTSPGVSYVHGSLTTQTWTNDRIYIIDNNVGVATGHVLTIEAGTVVRFDGHYSLSVAGTLVANGTAQQPIRFMSDQVSPMAGDWKEIQFLNSSVDATFDSSGNYVNGSILRHTIIEHGRGVAVDQAAPFIAHNRFENMEGAGANYEGIMGNNATGIIISDNTFDGVSISLWGGTGTIIRNKVSSVTGASGIYAYGQITITANQVENCNTGLSISGTDVIISQNSITNNEYYGMNIDSPTVISNTVMFNGEAEIYVEGNGAPVLFHNNLIADSGNYALYNNTTNSIIATGNWWGGVGSEIEDVIYDGNDDFALGLVDYSGYLSLPEQDAPAFMTGVTITPESPIGIETATFDLHYSRPMDQGSLPSLYFYDNKRGTSTRFLETDGLGDNSVGRVEVDSQDRVWFGNFESNSKGISVYDHGSWQVFNTANSGLATNPVGTIFEDDTHRMLFAYGRTISTFDGTNWGRLQPTNGFASSIEDIEQTPNGHLWIATGNGLYQFDGQNWLHHTTESGLSSNNLSSLAVDTKGQLWITWRINFDSAGISRFDGSNWKHWTIINGIPLHYTSLLFADSTGRVWLSSEEIDVINGNIHTLHLFQNETWVSCNDTNPIWGVCSGVYGRSSNVDEDSLGRVWFDRIAIDPQGNIVYQDLPVAPVKLAYMAFDSHNNRWHAYSWGLGAIVYWQGKDYTVDSAGQWLDDQTYQVEYEMTSLVPRGSYNGIASGGQGTDGIRTPSDYRFEFTVDYAGEITDQTPPSAPFILAGGIVNNISGFEAFWFPNDVDSSITGYRYALGTAPGAKDIINWTTTNETSLELSGLGLVAGQQYWLSVQARNAGGLWSESAYSGFVAGQPMSRVFLPIIVNP